MVNKRARERERVDLIQFLQELHGSIIRLRRRPAALVPPLLNPLLLDGVEAREAVIQLDPLVPAHAAQAHSDIVRPVPERAVGEWLRGVDIPVRVRCRGRPLEFYRDPYAWVSFGGCLMNGGIATGCGLFEVWCWGSLGRGRFSDPGGEFAGGEEVEEEGEGEGEVDGCFEMRGEEVGAVGEDRKHCRRILLRAIRNWYDFLVGTPREGFGFKSIAGDEDVYVALRNEI